MSSDESNRATPNSGGGSGVGLPARNAFYGNAMANRTDLSAIPPGLLPPHLQFPAVGMMHSTNRFFHNPSMPAATMPPVGGGVPPAAARSQGSQSRTAAADKSMRYTNEEKIFLGTILCEIKPLGPQAWEQVTHRYNQQFPTRPRITENLRKQFNNLASKKIPTGDPNMPEWVRLCKRAKHLMIQDSELSTMSDEEDDGNHPPPDPESDVAGEDAVMDSTADAAVAGASVAAVARAAVSVSRNQSSSDDTNRRPAKRTHKKPAEDIMEKYLKVLVVQDKLKAKREARKEKKKEKEVKRQNKMMMQMFATAVAMFAAGRVVGTEDNREAQATATQLSTRLFESNSSSSSSGSSSEDDDSIESSTMSSISSSDSPPTKRAKQKQQKKMKGKKSGNKRN